MAVYVNGNEIEEASAVRRAAELLSGARLPVIGGLMTDIAGAQAALGLARISRGVVDHVAGDALTRAARIMREGGGSPVSLGELRNRSDIVVLVGEGPLKADPGLLARIFPGTEGLPRPGDNPRELIVLGPKPKDVPDGVKLTHIDLGNQDMVVALGMLGAAIAGHSLGDASGQPAEAVRAAGARIKEAAFAVFLTSAAELGEAELHVVLDMVRHLSNTTRAGTYSPPAPANGDGVNLCSVWTCGLPIRTSFAGGEPVHDPWAYSAERLIATGESDLLVWIDALGGGYGLDGAVPPKGAPTILLARAGKADPAAAEIVFEVAAAAEDHDAALYLGEISGIGLVAGTSGGTGLPSAADILRRIAGQLAPEEAQ